MGPENKTGSNNITSIAVMSQSSSFFNNQISDASGDSTPMQVAHDGAINIDLQNITLQGDQRAQVTAVDLETGTTYDLGTQRLHSNQASLLVDLRGQLDQSHIREAGDDFSFTVTIQSHEGGNTIAGDKFSQILTVANASKGIIKGDETVNDFEHERGEETAAIQVYQGLGGTDSISLKGYSRNDVAFFNGKNQLDNASASELGQQAFYGGTVFDSLVLNNGDEIYMQGIENLHFDDVSINLSPRLDDQSREQWNIQAMDVNGAWRFNTGNDNVILASLDTGFTGNADYTPRFHTDLAGVNYRNRWASSSDNTHGHMAMSVMGSAHRGDDVAGIAPDAPLVAYNVYGNGSMLLQTAIQDALQQRQPHQKVVFQGGIQGNSWWNHSPSRQRRDMESLLESSEEHGFFAIAAGNGGPGGNLNDPLYRQRVSGLAHGSKDFNNIASVGALTYTGTSWKDGVINPTGTDLATYSNRGDGLTLVAPTNSRALADADGSVRTFTGTSAANPNLAGVAALVWSEFSDLSGGELREILTSSATDLGSGGYDHTFGHGLVNAEAAIRRTHALAHNPDLASLWSHQDFLA